MEKEKNNTLNNDNKDIIIINNFEVEFIYKDTEIKIEDLLCQYFINLGSE